MKAITTWLLMFAAAGCAERAAAPTDPTGEATDGLEFRLTRLSAGDRAAAYGQMIRATGIREVPFVDALGHRVTTDDLAAAIRSSLSSGKVPFIFIYVRSINSAVSLELLDGAVSAMNQVLDKAHATPETVRVVFSFVRAESPAGGAGSAK